VAEPSRRRVVRQSRLFLEHPLDGCARLRFSTTSANVDGHEATANAQSRTEQFEAVTGCKQWHIDNLVLHRTVGPPPAYEIGSDCGHGQLLFDNGGGKVLRHHASALSIALPDTDLSVPQTLWLAFHARSHLVREVDDLLAYLDVASLHSNRVLAAFVQHTHGKLLHAPRRVQRVLRAAIYIADSAHLSANVTDESGGLIFPESGVAIEPPHRQTVRSVSDVARSTLFNRQLFKLACVVLQQSVFEATVERVGFSPLLIT